ncbi:dihydrofolate reductase family protein [Oryzobacter terrae]|uniref:dihydrofolate reductase family protein n=1 Tax=Oryzobacter terrae TaxID=1620385 RepID=UPI0036723117
MARVIVSNIVSLDGSFDGPVNGVLDLPMDPAFDAHNLERFRAADTVLLGARSYEGFSSYWPAIQHHPPVSADDDPAAARMYDDVNRAISRRYDEVDVLVVSDSTVVADDAPWRERTTVVPRADIATVLSARPGECVVFGSRTMWNGLLARGLVDELHLMVGARWLGGGTPLLDAATELRLLDVRRFEGSDNVVLVYAPVAAPADAGVEH